MIEQQDNIIESDLKYIASSSLVWDTFKDKTVLVSGASGFLPAYMVQTLLYLNKIKQLNIKILGLVRNLERAKERFAQYLSQPGLRLIKQNVCDAVKIDEKIDFIIHAASIATPKYFREDPVGTLMPNVVGTANLLNLAKDNKVEGFLFFSTSGVYGFVDKRCYPIKEGCFGSLDPVQLASCYLESKRMGENMCIAWLHQHGVPVKIVRPAITYGPGIKLNDGRSFADFISNIVNNRDIELFTDGKVLRNYCYVADATVAFFMVMLKGEVGQAYNVASDQEIKVIDLAKKLVKEVFPEKKLKVVRKKDVTKRYLRVEFPRTAVDVNKLKQLGWKLNFGINDGFKRTVQYYNQGGEYAANAVK